MLKINGIHEKLNFIYWCKLFFSYFVSLLNLIHFSEDFYFPLITGFSKTLPTGQCLDKFMQLCSLKHGLEADYSHYAAVRFGYESSHEIWLPCSFVLQGSGLQPAPKSSRASRAMCALQSFMGLLNGK
jgi:hypothetical protein